MPVRGTFPMPNTQKPVSGPIGLPITLDFTGITTQDIDLALELQSGTIDYVQSVYIDNSANANALTLTFGGAQYKIVCKANFQGIFPVIAPVGIVRFTAACAGNPKIPIILFNTVVPYFLWAAV